MAFKWPRAPALNYHEISAKERRRLTPQYFQLIIDFTYAEFPEYAQKNREQLIKEPSRFFLISPQPPLLILCWQPLPAVTTNHPEWP